MPPISRTNFRMPFENGTFIEGFIRFIDTNDTHADLTMPYLGFYGQWDQLPIIDKTMYPE